MVLKETTARNGETARNGQTQKKERKKERTAHVGSACGVVQKNDDTRRSFGGRSSRARHERAVSMKARSTLERDRAVGGGASAATVAFAEPREFSSDAKSVEMFRATFDRVPCVFGSRPKGAREISTDMAPVERLLAGVADAGTRAERTRWSGPPDRPPSPDAHGKAPFRSDGAASLVRAVCSVLVTSAGAGAAGAGASVSISDGPSPRVGRASTRPARCET